MNKISKLYDLIECVETLCSALDSCYIKPHISMLNRMIKETCDIYDNILLELGIPDDVVAECDYQSLEEILTIEEYLEAKKND